MTFLPSMSLIINTELGFCGARQVFALLLFGDFNKCQSTVLSGKVQKCSFRNWKERRSTEFGPEFSFISALPYTYQRFLATSIGHHEGHSAQKPVLNTFLVTSTLTSLPVSLTDTLAFQFLVPASLAPSVTVLHLTAGTTDGVYRYRI
ncbi:hypothetical protein MG293_010488 [Ovis ammon polii]|uniref:Uncharacterized protein n=1 Tax=Ovis ammon polii TaxID=230172 RepID=A0AAD4YA88_OVIAM|nr:hypothetical protein MG293_010488 [Ovis ammon polii]